MNCHSVVSKLILVFVFTLQEVSSSELDLIDFRDERSILSHKPILTAHRGGVVNDQSPECSLNAIRLAKEHGYSLIELDIRQSADRTPIVFHDDNMMEACGIDREIIELTTDEIIKIKFKSTKETIVTLDTALEYCRKLNLGVMLDLKVKADKQFYVSIAALIQKHGLTNATVTISGDPLFRKCIKPVALLTVSSEEFAAVQNGETLDLKKRYWFGLPERLPSEIVSKLQQCGALVMPAINTFRYPQNNHFELAQKDIQRLNQAGVDGYQIDSIYKQFFQE